MLTAISELNAEYGFNPARGGTDVCGHYELPILEIFNTPEVMEGE